MKVRNILLAATVPVALALIPSAASAASYPGPPPAKCTQHSFAEGSSGGCVRWIQQDANFNNAAYRFHGVIRVDGSFGPATRSAVSAFQYGCDRAFRLRPGHPGYMSPGGVVGRWTWTGLITSCFEG